MPPILPSAARTTMSVLRAEAAHLSPAVGLALGAGLLRRLYDLEPAVQLAEGARVTNGVDGSASVYRASASGALLRDCFHRNHPDEPLRPTTNRSLPAAHLSASLTAHILGLAWRRPGSDAVALALREARCSETGLDVPKLARTTGVTIARFERLVTQVESADDEASAPLANMGSAILLRHLWLRSTSRQELWTYLQTLDAYYGPVLATPPDRADAAAAEPQCHTWVDQPPFEASELNEAAVLQAAVHLFGQSTHIDRPASACASGLAAEGAPAFEQLAAALALGGSRPAPLLQGRYGYFGQPAVADCAEMVARELLNALLWCPATQAFDASRLPPSSTPELKAFYAPGGPADTHRASSGPACRGAAAEEEPTAAPEAGWHAGPPSYTPAAEAWFGLCQNLKHVSYLAGLPKQRYEMAPTVENVASCLGVLLGQADAVRTPEALGRLWQTIQPERGVRIHTNAQRDRMFLLERTGGPPPAAARRADALPAGAASPAEEQLLLELVMSERLNHAFAIHHWRPPAWQPSAAREALRGRRAEWWASARAASAAGMGPSNGVASPPRLALLPALLQPLLSDGAFVAQLDEESAPLGAVPMDERRWQRLRLLSCDPSDLAAIATSVLALLDAGQAESGAATSEEAGEAAAAREADEMLVARVLALSGGLAGVGDELLVRVATRIVASDSAALYRAATLEGPLAAPVALLGARRKDADAAQSLAAWGRAVTTSLMGLRQALRLTLRAATI